MLGITFLGTGTSIGVPVLLCDCPVCRSTDPRDQRTRSSIYVRNETTAFVVDTGPDFRQQALRERLERIDAALYTHEHVDHIMGFDDLRRFSTLNGNRLPIYASAQTMQSLQRVFNYAFSGQARFPGYIHPEPHIVTGPFGLGDLVIVPIRVEHGRLPVLGFLFKQQHRPKAAYISDCKIVPDEGLALLQDVDTLIIGTPCYKPHPTHMSLAEGVALAELLRPRRTFLTHLSHDFGHAETASELPEGIYLGYDGLKITV
jgi:phosphoribosyl 1,2-cyclic phosphate phosphodiesterase